MIAKNLSNQNYYSFLLYVLTLTVDNLQFAIVAHFNTKRIYIFRFTKSKLYDFLKHFNVGLEYCIKDKILSNTSKIFGS